MVGSVAALVAIALGAWGPRFRWLGAILLASATIAAGIFATLGARDEARAAGLQFGMTIGSVVIALLLQALFMLAFYGLAAVVAHAFKAFTGAGPMPTIES